jgi:hypothetical protein
MNTNRTEGLFALAEELLNAAKHEQERAEEDVVSHLICANSRQSIANYLAGYLLQKNIPIEHPVSLVSLKEQCISLDARSELLDLGEINCRGDLKDRQYCLELDKVGTCLKIAQHTRSIVLAEIPGY